MSEATVAVATIEPANTAVQAQPNTEGAIILSMIDRLIARPDVPVEKLEQMFALHQKVQAEAARRAYLAAFAELQSTLPAAVRRGRGHNAKSYARYEDVSEALREPFSLHGFSHWFSIDQTGDKMRVTTFLGHAGGHVESSNLILPLDSSGGKTPMHALGSTISYGKRYGLLTVTGIATDDDDDGKKAGAGGVISDEQREELTKLITETKTDIAKFLELGGVESLSDIPANQFEAAKAKLIAKRNHMQKAAAK